MWLWLAVTFTSGLALASLLWWQLAIFYQHQKFAAQLKIFLASAYRQLDFKQLLAQVVAFVKQSFGSGSCVLIGNFLDEATFSSSECALSKKELQACWQTLAKHWQRCSQAEIISLAALYQQQQKQLGRVLAQQELILAVPIVIFQQLSGALLLGCKCNRREYQPSQLAALQDLLAQVAPLLSRAAIYYQSQNFASLLQRRVDRATAKLRALNQQLIQADQMKDEFVSIASHELRTPMTAIKNYLWLIAKNNRAGKYQENRQYLQIVSNSTERLIDLVNDMLTISRLDYGIFTLNLARTNLTTLVETAIADLVPLAQEKKISLAHTLPKAVILSLDEKKILEVLHNVLGNAIKFTKKGGVSIALERDSGEVRLQIIDTGSGIDPADQKLLFRKFARLEKSYVKLAETGTGLGLYISREIMKKHGGEITFSSQLGVGSVFTLHFPR